MTGTAFKPRNKIFSLASDNQSRGGFTLASLNKRQARASIYYSEGRLYNMLGLPPSLRCFTLPAVFSRSARRRSKHRRRPCSQHTTGALLWGAPPIFEICIRSHSAHEVSPHARGALQGVGCLKPRPDPISLARRDLLHRRSA